MQHRSMKKRKPMRKKQEKDLELRKNYPSIKTFRGGERGCDDQNHATRGA